MNIFVTGTDTDIGKTVVSAILACELNASYWKPVQSGTPADSSFIKRFLPEDRIFSESYALSQPLSPHLAARLDNTKISLDEIALPNSSLPLIVEGAGGVLVPLNERYLMIDLIKKLDIPALIVARSSLGTINHTLLTLTALRDRNIPVLGVAMVGEKNLENKAAIEKYGTTQVLLEVEPMENFSRDNFRRVYRNCLFEKYHGEGFLCH